MAKKRAWQRGAADLVGVATGMAILAIVTAGTAAAMVFGREALIREEHYKVAAYQLRGLMEQVQAELTYEPQARTSLDQMVYRTVDLDYRGDRAGSEPVRCTLSRDRVGFVDLPETGPGIDYYVITVRASWTERDYAENTRNVTGQHREILFKTALVYRGMLG